jgi:hypothetical protein
MERLTDLSVCMLERGPRTLDPVLVAERLARRRPATIHGETRVALGEPLRRPSIART